jgi:hypothetical protein
MDMMNISKKIWLWMFVATVMASSCTERIEIDLEDTYTRLVVYGNLTTDTTAHLVEITTTSSYYYNQAPPSVTGAEVEISDSEGNVVYLSELSAGKYYTPEDYFAVPGRTYYLRIELAEPINENSIYTATSELPPINPIDSITLKLEENWGPDGIMQVQCYYQDPPTREFYMFNIFKNGEWLTDTISNRFISDDEFYNGNYTNGIGVGFLNQANEREKVKPGDTITFQGGSITEDYYNFIWTLQQEASGFSNPLFSGPPANVQGNISDGAIGFFAVYAVSYASTVYETEQ